VVVEKNKLLVRKISTGPWNDLAKKVGEVVRQVHAQHGIYLKKDLLLEAEKKLPLESEVWINQDVVKSPLGRKIRMVLQEKIAPSLAAHGGQVTLVDIQDGKCVLSFSGGCQGCSQVAVTVKEGIEQVLRQEFPEIKGVIDATNHATGANPYYRTT
jgi:Fe-S cluster biogenesis protein NfuA